MNLKIVIEALLFAAKEPLSPKEVKKILKETHQFEPTEITQQLVQATEGEILSTFNELRQEIDHWERGFFLEETYGGFQLASRPEFSPWLRHLLEKPKSHRLSPSAMETLAIIAYRQPISRAQIEAIRGVAVDGVVITLQERGFIHATGRADVPGRPLLYETTDFFLEHFGLKNLEELPNAQELRRANLVSSPLNSSTEETVIAPELPLNTNESEPTSSENRTDRPANSEPAQSTA